jgi:nucleoside-diphosphate-sugar epimerase
MTDQRILDAARGARVPFTVLGGRGFIGSRLVAFLARNGIPCQAPDRDDTTHFRAPLGHVVYCIGLTADYAVRPFDTVEAHVSLAARYLKECDFASFVYLSSTRLYDAGGGGQVEAPLHLDPSNPRHIYDFSKGLGESLCNVAGRDRARVARLSSVYSDDLGDETFLHGLLRRARSEPEVLVQTAPDSERDYVHIDDVCLALVAIAVMGRRLIYNVASGENVSNVDLFAAIEEANGCRIRASAPRTGARFTKVDVLPLEEDFQLTPKHVRNEVARILSVGPHGAGS